MIDKMSFPFTIEKNAGKHFKERAMSLIRFDEVRVMQLMELVQYSVIYCILGFTMGAALDRFFSKFDENAPISDVVFDVIGQTIIFIIFVFYIRKIAKLVPFLFVVQWDLNRDGKVPKYKPYMTAEYSGELTIGLVLISSQLNYLKKIDLLCREIYSKYMGYAQRIAAVI